MHFCKLELNQQVKDIDMRQLNYLIFFILIMGVSGAVVAKQSKSPSMQEIWKLLQVQQKEIKKLKRENRKLKKRLNIVADTIQHPTKMSTKPQRHSVAKKSFNQKSKATTTTTPSRESYTSIESPVRKHGSESIHTKSGRGATVNGYGEMHYNNLDSKKEMDFHRFVLMFSYRFNNRLRFSSELEVEHSISGDGKVGEVELEQGYIEYDFTGKHSLKAGLFLLPVGILNETHEPTTFYGVERNPIEKNIIPTTWWEGGLLFSGQLGNKGLSYDIGLHSGLKITSANSYVVRKGRQSVGEADATDLAYTARLRWTGTRGLAVSASMQYQENIGQSLDAGIGNANYYDMTLVWNRGRFGIRGLYAMWDLNGAGPQSIGADKQEGWYLETSYKLTSKFGVFSRYAVWDNAAGDATDSEKEQWNVGVNFWASENVVFKFDVQRQGGVINDDGFNLGVGYHF